MRIRSAVNASKASSVKEGASMVKQLFDKLMKGIDKMLDSLDLSYEGRTIKINGRDWEEVHIELQNGKECIFQIARSEEHENLWDLQIKAEGCKKVTKLDRMYDELAGDIQEYLDSNKLVAASKKLQVSLKRVCGSSDDTIQLTAITCNYPIPEAMKTLDAVLENEDFEKMITEDDASFEIVEIDDEYDVNPVDDVDTASCYEEMLKATAMLYHNLQSMSWGAKGENMYQFKGQVESLLWDIKYEIDFLAELMVEKTGIVPHISQYCCSDNIIDTTQGFDAKSGFEILQTLLRDHVQMLETYYVNLDHDVQATLDNWVRSLSKTSEYSIGRSIGN